MSTARTSLSPEDRKTRRADLTVAISAGAVPLLILGGFAMMAVIPVVLILVFTLRSAHLRVLRWWSAALAALYAAALVMWAVGPDPAPSLTKEIHPAHAGLIIVAALAVLVRYVIMARRRAAAK